MGFLGAGESDNRVRFAASSNKIVEGLLPGTQIGDAIAWEQLFSGLYSPSFLNITADTMTVVSQSFTGPNIYSSETGITAFATGGQGSATALTKEFNEITVCATAGDSVLLPTAVAGLSITVKNDGAAAADVFPFSGDTINDGSANAAVRLASHSTLVFKCISATNWETTSQVFGATDGAVGAPSWTFNSQPDMGAYKISSTQLGFSVGGVLQGGFNSSGIFADVISEQTSTLGVTVDGVLLKDSTITVVEVISKGVASTEGYGLMTLKSKSSSIAFSGGATEVIPIAVPADCLLVAAQLRNDTLLTATTGVSYAADFSGGSSISLGSGHAFAKNTKVSGFMDANVSAVITSAPTNITLTPNAGTLDTGTVTAVVYYYELTALTDAA